MKDGSLKSDEQKKFFTKFMGAFSDWVSESESGNFESFMKHREKAATAYVHGDSHLVDAMAAVERLKRHFLSSEWRRAHRRRQK